MRRLAIPLLLSAFVTPLVAPASAAHAASHEPGCDARGCTASSPPPKPGSLAAKCPDCAGPPLMPTSAELRRLSARQDWTRASSVARANLISLAIHKLGGPPSAISFLHTRFVDAGGELGYVQAFCGGYVSATGVSYQFMVLVPIDDSPVHSYGVPLSVAASASGWPQSWHALCEADGVRGPAARWP